jgi:hypothetical protein
MRRLAARDLIEAGIYRHPKSNHACRIVSKEDGHSESNCGSYGTNRGRSPSLISGKGRLPASAPQFFP